LLLIELLYLPVAIVGAATLLRYPLENTTTVRYYYDHDPAIGPLRDYEGQVGASAKTKDKHRGTDYPLAKGLPVVAAADGVVLSLAENGVVDNLKDDCGVTTEYSREDCQNDNYGAGNAIKTGTPTGRFHTCT
jgi:murein DD-endopeptidase MepM/ murein hydrolase activator NlpD